MFSPKVCVSLSNVILYVSFEIREAVRASAIQFAEVCETYCTEEFCHKMLVDFGLREALHWITNLEEEKQGIMNKVSDWWRTMN